MAGDDPGFLAKFPDRSVAVSFPGLYAAPGQLPPGPLCGIAGVTGVEEEQLALGVEYDQPHHAALDDGQAVIGQRYRAAACGVHGQAAWSISAEDGMSAGSETDGQGPL